MAKFIKPEDYDASIHQEILDALIRSDRQIVEICEDRAIAEMRGYLSARYDCDRVFAAEGDDRNQLVLMMAIDIAIYHIFSIHNPRNMSQIRTDRYERAVEWLKGVRKGDITVDGLPEVEPDAKAAAAPYQIRSNRKRTNNF
ncbi:phage protein Gp36 family protein [Alistipes sp.]|uniref:phage protein Gp36 family protein n=1 Tax=Alistipes sp. TaxID=1872444 RepID=UPI003AEFB90D